MSKLLWSEHFLRTHPEPYQAVVDGDKTAEFRQNDRNFRVGDILWLREFDPDTQEYTGRESKVEITHMTTGYGIPKGFTMLSFKAHSLGHVATRKTVHKHHPNQCPNAGHLGPGPWPCDLCQLEGGAE